jgi:hypothetical protein
MRQWTKKDGTIEVIGKKREKVCERKLEEFNRWADKLDGRCWAGDGRGIRRGMMQNFRKMDRNNNFLLDR